MNYQEALDYINDKNKYGSRLGLESIGKLMALLGNPQKDLRYIHIAGTNGKGSTSAYIASCLATAGYRVGLYTSPYLERFNERISINGNDIPDDDLSRITELVKQKADTMVSEGMQHPTTFELVTAIGFMYFYEKKVDYVVLEVGLGGRFDSTNIIDTSLASVITTLDYDHMEILGSTIAEIAYQKAGIIKEENLVISYPQVNEALEVLKHVSSEKHCKFYLTDVEAINIKEINEYGSLFDYNFEDYNLKDIQITMLGQYQVYNASLAITTLLKLKDDGKAEFTVEQLYEGLKNTKWKGRLEILKRKPTFVIDGAHNIQGISNLVNSLKLFNYDRLILGIAILKDKDYNAMLKVLAPLADEIVATEVKLPRKLEAEKLGEVIKEFNTNVHVEKDITSAVKKALELASENDLIVFGGSLYLIGDVRTMVNLL